MDDSVNLLLRVDNQVLNPLATDDFGIPPLNPASFTPSRDKQGSTVRPVTVQYIVPYHSACNIQRQGYKKNSEYMHEDASKFFA